MKLITVAIALFLNITTHSAFSRIHETESKFTSRYNDSIGSSKYIASNTPFTVNSYFKNNIMVWGYFVTNTAEAIKYAKFSEDKSKLVDLTEGEIRALLSVNQIDGEWQTISLSFVADTMSGVEKHKMIEEAETKRVWMSSKGILTAIYNKKTHSLFITSTHFLPLYDNAISADMNGF